RQCTTVGSRRAELPLSRTCSYAISHRTRVAGATDTQRGRALLHADPDAVLGEEPLVAAAVEDREVIELDVGTLEFVEEWPLEVPCVAVPSMLWRAMGTPPRSDCVLCPLGLIGCASEFR